MLHGFRVFSLGLLLALSFTAISSLRAQVLNGSIVGVVSDPSSAVVPAAQVSVASESIGVNRSVTTDEGGRYSLVNLQPGTYELTVEAAGFRPASRTGVEVTANNVSRLDVELEVGAVTEVVSVSAAAAQLQTDKSDTRSELTKTAMTNLPLANYRNYQSLVNLVPGATPAAFQNSPVDSPARALTTNINGTNRNNNNTRVDGATNVYIWLPHHTAYVPPVETIESVNVTTSAFDAEQGMAGGSAVTVVSKSGTNEFHGVASWYHDDESLRARNFFLRTDKPDSSNDIFTGTIGGPIVKDKLFFFFGYERFMERAGKSGNFGVPTTDMRAGDFSGFSTTIYDPLTGNADGTDRSPFPGNRIPNERHSRVILGIQEMIPEPNLPGHLNNFAVSDQQKMDRDNFDVKINWNPAPNHNFFGKYSRMQAIVNGVMAFGEAGGPELGAPGTGDTDVNVITFGDTWTISPNLLWDATFGFTKFDQTVLGPDHGVNWGTEVWDIPGANGPTGGFGVEQVLDQCPDPDGLCYTGQAEIRAYQHNWGNDNGWQPMWRNDRSWTFTSNMSWIKGAHELRFGFDTVKHHLNHWQPEVNEGPRGLIRFDGDPTALRGGASPNQLNQYASALLGLVNDYQKAEQFFLMTAREWQFGLYARDRWQVTPKLTLNLGLRWEYYPLMSRDGRGLERWDPSTNMVLLGGLGATPDDAGITVSKALFAPRIGIAYRATTNTVIRTGYGITYDPLPFARPLRGLYPASLGGAWNSDSFQWVNTVDEGFPAEIERPDVSAGQIPLPANISMGPRSPWGGELNRGYIQSWNFTIERRLPADFVTSVAYVGNQTTHQLADRDINAGFPGSGNSGRPLASNLGRRIGTAMWDGWLSANYHSLQVAINKQMSNGLFLKGAYTFSKAINMTDEDGWASVGRNWEPEIGWNRGPAGYDRKHMFVMGFLYELPFGPGKPFATSGAGSWILRDWQFNGTFSHYTGRPFTVTASGASVNAPSNTQTADQVKDEVIKIGGVGPGAKFYDPDAFAPVTGQRFGSSGRNILSGPNWTNLDMSIFRNFRFSERYALEFRAEAFNVSNTPHFNNPASNASNSNFMEISSAQSDERQFRFGLRFSF